MKNHINLEENSVQTNITSENELLIEIYSEQMENTDDQDTIDTLTALIEELESTNKNPEEYIKELNEEYSDIDIPGVSDITFEINENGDILSNYSIDNIVEYSNYTSKLKEESVLIDEYISSEQLTGEQLDMIATSLEMQEGALNGYNTIKEIIDAYNSGTFDIKNTAINSASGLTVFVAAILADDIGEYTGFGYDSNILQNIDEMLENNTVTNLLTATTIGASIWSLWGAFMVTPLPGARVVAILGSLATAGLIIADLIYTTSSTYDSSCVTIKRDTLGDTTITLPNGKTIVIDKESMMTMLQDYLNIYDTAVINMLNGLYYIKENRDFNIRQAAKAVVNEICTYIDEYDEPIGDGNLQQAYDAINQVMYDFNSFLSDINSGLGTDLLGLPLAYPGLAVYDDGVFQKQYNTYNAVAKFASYEFTSTESILIFDPCVPQYSYKHIVKGLKNSIKEYIEFKEDDIIGALEECVSNDELKVRVMPNIGNISFKKLEICDYEYIENVITAIGDERDNLVELIEGIEGSVTTISEADEYISAILEDSQ